MWRALAGAIDRREPSELALGPWPSAPRRILGARELLPETPTMSHVDAKVAAIVDKTHDSDDEDALIAELEADDSFDGLREQRMQQLHAELARAKQMRNSEHGTYQEIKDEKALMDITTATKLCVVHFFHADFNRCRIMDNHLEVCTSSCPPSPPRNRDIAIV